MAAPTKNQKIAALVKLVQKRCRGQGITQPPQRSVLATLMYAALLENATFDKADLAYAILENYYIDWNEIRVCSVRELADTLIDLPHPEAAAVRVRQSLQGIFEQTYMFDLEEMRKKGKALSEHFNTLESMSAGTPYMLQYVAQIALDGHIIPFDEASLRIMRRLGLSQLSQDSGREICLGLDRVILKKSGLTFAAQLHHFAAGYYDVPDSPELLSLLSAIDPKAVDRSWSKPVTTSPASDSGLSASSESGTKTETPRSPSQKTTSKKAPAKKTTAKKTPTKKSAAKPGAKPDSPKKPSGKVSGDQSASKKPTPKSPKPVPPTRKAILKKTATKKEPVKNTSPKKPLPKKAPPKKAPSKPVQKLKTVSPSKSLRKKKPK